MATPHSPRFSRPATGQADWTRSDRYHNSFLLPHDEALDFALKNTAAHGIPAISVSAAEGAFLNLVAKGLNAKRIVEVGTLGAYSSIWMARALPDGGELTSLEVSPKHAKVACSSVLVTMTDHDQVSEENLAHAGLSSKAKVLLGPALETMPKLSPTPPVDLVFIDADKENNGPYFQIARKLVRTGGVIIVDNVVRNGRVADPDVNSPDILGIRKLLEMVKNDPGVEATTIGTAGEKGYDGFMYISVRKGI
ncbi:S-adenosyl-L-methionine-dependent methyltransferase [Calocera cornea HHB12733]|uniref:S-adenosyl-L-methionine-dependent methyltransferase n=1 Tax=Calocera cornea HHB12733 TaxID=1353952 RepID=A0A165HVC8_9BASI|nr:S-adenosyl-L-methionine-dependent methyltransferase [Calocera cornea HHB12733]